MEAMFANSLDFTYVGPSPAINAYSKSNGTLLQIVAGAVQGGSGLVVPTHSEARTQKDFQGKIIATPQLGNTQDIACRTWLALGGVAVTQSRGDASILPTPNPEQISLFRQGKLDGSWTVEPWISRLEKEAGGKLLFLETDAVTTVLTAQKRILENSRTWHRPLLKLTENSLSGLSNIPRKLKNRRRRTEGTHPFQH